MAEELITLGGLSGGVVQQVASASSCASPGAQIAALALGGLAQQPAPLPGGEVGVQPAGQAHRGLQSMQGSGGLKRRPVRALQLGESASTSTEHLTTAQQPFLHARDTPRAAEDLFAPPRSGTVWVYSASHVNADGADAGPNAIKEVCLETDKDYVQNRGHCSVHEQRNVQQKKHEIFNGDSDAHKRSARVVNGMLEQLKDHSTFEAHAKEGKRLLRQHLEQEGEQDAAAYLQQNHLKHKNTMVEMNAPSLRAKGEVRTSRDPLSPPGIH